MATGRIGWEAMENWHLALWDPRPGPFLLPEPGELAQVHLAAHSWFVVLFFAFSRATFTNPPMGKAWLS